MANPLKLKNLILTICQLLKFVSFSVMSEIKHLTWKWIVIT